MLKYLRNKLILVLFLTVTIGSYSQSFSDLSNINFSELNDSQLDLLLRRSAAQGLNQFDLIKMAKEQGLSQADLEKLDKRFKSAKTIARVSENASAPLEETRLRKKWEDELEVYRELESDVFGYNVFRGNTFLSFQSNLNVPTPDDYVVGPGDKLFVDIYGESENYYQVEISPEGSAIFENIGPVNFNGMSIEEARKKLVSKLKPIYTGLVTGRTNVSISVGVPRAIRVNVVGQVNLPGTYTFSAFNTVYNAIYVAGGITEKASLRNIKVFRNNKLVNKVDVYKFLTKGDGSSNIRLENNDLILVGPYTNRVQLLGEVKVPGIFETKDGESLLDLINYSGGFTEKAFKKSVKLTRVIDNNLRIIDISYDQLQFFTPKMGDVFEIGQVSQVYKNRVIIKGAVNRPGEFSLSENKTLLSLIKRAEGFKPDVFRSRSFIIRTNDDFSTSNISFNINDLFEGKISDIKLNEEDVIQILSKNDIEADNYIKISGQINDKGAYPFSRDLTIKDAILLAGGFKEGASSNNIELTRRVNENYETLENFSEVIILNLQDDSSEDNYFKLEPFDEIVIRKDPKFNVPKFVKIEGQVMYPGQYAISSENDRISDLLIRAGGLKPSSYPPGATLLRYTEFKQEVSDLQKQINSLNELRTNLESDKESTSENQIMLIERLTQNIQRLESEITKNPDYASIAKKERISEIAEKNDIAFSKNQFEAIGIDLEDILKSPGVNSDLLLEEGDVLVIPKKKETVRIRGELLYPTTVRYIDNKSMKYFLNGAGGFDVKAKRSGTYVVYANGDVARTKKFLFFNLYPKVEPGSEIIVPAKPVKSNLGLTQLLTYSTGIATLILAISQIN